MFKIQKHVARKQAVLSRLRKHGRGGEKGTVGILGSPFVIAISEVRKKDDEIAIAIAIDEPHAATSGYRQEDDKENKIDYPSVADRTVKVGERNCSVALFAHRDGQRRAYKLC